MPPKLSHDAVIRIGNATFALPDTPCFDGFGEIHIGNTPVRGGQRPMFVHIRNPWGVELFDYRLTSQQTLPDGGVALEFGASRRDGGQMEWMLHTVRARHNTADWSRPAAPAEGTVLRMELRPVERTFAGRKATGFSYRYTYHSKDIPIYRIVDRGTWEPGGAAPGNTIWLRNAFSPAIKTFESADTFYSTEWYLPSAVNPNIFQFLPWQTTLQGFSMTANPKGTLITWATDPAHIRSLFEKQRGDDVIVHMHEHCGDLGNEFATSPVEVLWVEGGLDHVEALNLYEATRDLVSKTLHRKAGIREERATSYGVIEEWGNADLVRYRKEGLPKLAAAGVKTLYTPNHFENNMNTFGVGNMCCTVDWKIAQSVGEDNMAAFCKEAAACGIRVHMWGNTALSTFGLKQWEPNGDPAPRLNKIPRKGSIQEVLDRSKDPFVRNASNAIEADHYTPVFAQVNLRDSVMMDHWIACWKDAHDRIGLGGIFLDSSFNMTSDKFHWIANTRAHQQGATPDQMALLGKYRPAVDAPSSILSQYPAHLSMIARMQAIGYEYSGEDLGLFGINRSGPSPLEMTRSLPLWGNCLGTFDPAALADLGCDPDAIFFKGLAYRMIWQLAWRCDNGQLSWRIGGKESPLDTPSDKQFAWLRMFSEAEPLMHEREVLPGEAGVIYRLGDRSVLWAFADMQIGLTNATDVRDLQDGSTRKGDRHEIAAWHVYVIESSARDLDVVSDDGNAATGQTVLTTAGAAV